MRKSVRHFALAVIFGSVVVISGCDSNNCSTVREQVLQPTSALLAMLTALKSGVEVKSACPTVLEELRNFPEGAQTIRDIASGKFNHSDTPCLNQREITRWEYECVGEVLESTCTAHSSTYSYCMSYETNTSDDTGFLQAINASTQIDTAYAIANEMCGFSEAGNPDAALTSSRELLNVLSFSVDPQTEQVYGMACDSIQ